MYVASSDGHVRADAAYVTMRWSAPGSSRRTRRLCGSPARLTFDALLARAVDDLGAGLDAVTGGFAPARTSMYEPSVRPSVACVGTGV